LVILIQHNIVLSNGASIWETEEEDLYQFDLEACLLRLRWGKMLAITQERFGDVVSSALNLPQILWRDGAGGVINTMGGTVGGL
jgi:DNA-directed RNA polymerase III subunit RPC3